MKLVCISDTHNCLNKIKIPSGDILIHAGDLTIDGKIHECENELKKLAKLKDQFEQIIFIPGNHDWAFEKDQSLMRQICKNLNITLLINEEVIINNLKFYGSPIQPEFCNLAFNKKRGDEIRKYWNLIPNDTNVLITHGPVYGFLDYVPYTNEHVGCQDLFFKVLQLETLKLHICGHIHYSYGEKFWNGIHFINASICDEQYLPINKPIEVDYL